jgi:hypothetical protein
MKPTPQSASLDKPNPIARSSSAAPVITNYSYQPTCVTTAVKSAAPPKEVAQLKTFRSLSRDFFGAETTREYIAEAVLFVWIMAVAAWPLGVTLNQLGTMMIWLAPGGPW